MVRQVTIELPSFHRGFHLITRQVIDQLGELPASGICHLLIMHTSAGLTLNENADPSVRDDFESFLNRLVPEKHPIFTHTVEGPDDMPAHMKSSLVGHSLTLPISQGRMVMGTWQGIYLCEFRNHGGPRRIYATLVY
jgi:secondary thiamine-phosphate synthase enzyme